MVSALSVLTLTVSTNQSVYPGSPPIFLGRTPQWLGLKRHSRLPRGGAPAERPSASEAATSRQPSQRDPWEAPYLSGALHSFKKLWRNMKTPGRRDVSDKTIKGIAWRAPWLRGQRCCSFLRERGMPPNPGSARDVSPELEACSRPQEEYAEGFSGFPAFPPAGRAAALTDQALGGGPAWPLSAPAASGPRAGAGPSRSRGLLQPFCDPSLLSEGDGKRAFVSRPAACDH